MPDVSVIIPTYNRTDLVCNAVDSVLAQTFSNYELIVVDDGSTDGTEKKLRKYSGKLKYIYQNNRGVSSARNRGIRESSSEYICFLDSDDLWKKRKLEIQFDEMKKNPEFHISYTDEIWIRNGLRVNPRKKHKKFSGDLFEKSLEMCIISASSVMIKREIFDKVGYFDENLEVCEDYDLWLRISKDYPVHFIDKPLIIKYGGHKDQLSHKYWGNDRFRVYSIEKLLKNESLEPRQKNLAVKELIRKCEILVNGFKKRKKYKEAEYYLKIIKKWKYNE
ncbi:glycosyltransferase family 2 protein [candidate division KSB1 bacterium]|nr:MAG: glycosyltransferase family 2 protein [candidate division KSB1 bacterium]